MSRAHIMIVDDDRDILEALRIRLEASGYRISQAENGAEALAQLAVQNFDLLVLDIGMPNLDGYEVVKQLKRDVAAPQTPTIFLTARASPMDFQQANEAQVDRYITKPYEPRVLMQAIDDLISQPAGALSR